MCYSSSLFFLYKGQSYSAVFTKKQWFNFSTYFSQIQYVWFFSLLFCIYVCTFLQKERILFSMNWLWIQHDPFHSFVVLRPKHLWEKQFNRVTWICPWIFSLIKSGVFSPQMQHLFICVEGKNWIFIEIYHTKSELLL